MDYMLILLSVVALWGGLIGWHIGSLPARGLKDVIQTWKQIVETMRGERDAALSENAKLKDQVHRLTIERDMLDRVLELNGKRVKRAVAALHGEDEPEPEDD